MSIKHYVVQTTDTSVTTEKVAQQQLVDAGFPVTWLATVEQRTIRRCTRSIVKSLFPGYLFVAFDADDDGWMVIPGLRGANPRGVHCVLGAGPLRPIALPAGALEQLQRKFEAGEFKPAPERDFTKGDRLQVFNGPWAPQIGVCELSDEERVTVLLTAFGELRPVQIRRDMLRRVA